MKGIFVIISALVMTTSPVMADAVMSSTGTSVGALSASEMPFDHEPASQLTAVPRTPIAPLQPEADGVLSADEPEIVLGATSNLGCDPEEFPSSTNRDGDLFGPRAIDVMLRGPPTCFREKLAWFSPAPIWAVSSSPSLS